MIQINILEFNPIFYKHIFFFLPKNTMNGYSWSKMFLMKTYWGNWSPRCVSGRKRSTSTVRSWTTRAAGTWFWRRSERWWTWLWALLYRTNPSIRLLCTSSPPCWQRCSLLERDGHLRLNTVRFISAYQGNPLEQKHQLFWRAAVFVLTLQWITEGFSI